MVSIEDDNGIFVDTGCLQIIKEGLYRGIKIIGGSKVSIDGFVIGFCQWESNLIPYQTGCVRIVVGNCDEFGIEGLLQVFQILDGVCKHDLIIQAILEGVLIRGR